MQEEERRVKDRRICKYENIKKKLSTQQILISEASK